MALSTEREKGAHLLRRFGLGASETELDYYMKDGLSGAIDKLLAYDTYDEGFNVEVEKFANKNNNQLRPQAVGAWWTLRMVATQRPLQEKMTLFWHDHFATSGEKVQGGPMMYGQNEILRRNATGNFRTMLTEASKDPAMLFWLDNQYNVKGKPNENFAREVMELFTLGVGHYTEKDIQEGARAFTGWSIGRPNGREVPAAKGLKGGQAVFILRQPQHDTGEKTFLGINGNLTGEDVLNHLCDMPRTAEYLTHKIWSWFAYADPEPAVISRIAAKFRDDNLNIKTLLRAIMSSPEFYSPKADRMAYKCPVDFTVVTLRQLGVAQAMAEALNDTPDNLRGIAPIQSAYLSMKNMGMQLLYPPDVAGWDGGASWITSATMMERIQWGSRLFGQAKSGPQLRYPAFGLFSGDTSPQGAAKKLVSVFDAPIPSYKMPRLVEAAQKACGSRVTPQNANATAASVTRLIFAAPEFQLM